MRLCRILQCGLKSLEPASGLRRFGQRIDQRGVGDRDTTGTADTAVSAAITVAPITALGWPAAVRGLVPMGLRIPFKVQKRL